MVPAFIINLPQDVERRAAIRQQLAGLPEFEPVFITGVDGRLLPDSVCVALSDSEASANSKGTLGCFLSHVMVWEQIARSRDAFALVLEDDADLAALGNLEHLALPADFDIVFINDRMARVADPGHHVLPMKTVLPALDLPIGSGADGYLLTPAAAQKLLAACKTDLYYGHVDGRLLRYVTTQDDLASLDASSFTATVIRFHHHGRHIPALGMLKGYVSAEPLTYHRPGLSTRTMIDDPEPEPARMQEGFSYFQLTGLHSYVDHALYRPARQSSLSQWSAGADPAADASRAVAGIAQSPYAFHTDFEGAPWWDVDLGAARTIEHVVIANRCENAEFAARAAPLAASISDDGETWTALFDIPENFIFGLDERSLVWTAPHPVTARFLRLSVTRPSYLHLRQVQIFGPPELLSS